MSTSQEALARLRGVVAGAVSRGRETAGAAREQGERLRERGRELADRIERREVTPRPSDVTPRGMRHATVAFRQHAGLPVSTSPSGEELLAEAQKAAEERAALPTPFRKAHSPAGLERFGVDEDDDFSQQRILE